MSTVHGVMAEGHWHTFHGRTEEAATRPSSCAGEMVRKNFCVNSHMIVVLPELAGALRRHADAVQSKDAKTARATPQTRLPASEMGDPAHAALSRRVSARSASAALILAAYGEDEKGAEIRG